MKRTIGMSLRRLAFHFVAYILPYFIMAIFVALIFQSFVDTLSKQEPKRILTLEQQEEIVSRWSPRVPKEIVDGVDDVYNIRRRP
jgi:hypothetical protein